MTIVLSCLFLASLHFICGILLPGMALHALPSRDASQKPSCAGVFIEALALGSLWSTCQWLVIYHATDWLAPGREVQLAAKHLSDAILVLATFVKRSATWKSTLFLFFKTIGRPGNLAITLLLVLFGVFATIQFPCAQDNAALYWVAALLADPNLSMDPQGSPAYISWIYWPTLWVWPDVAPNVAIAGAKITLSLLCGLVIHQLLGGSLGGRMGNLPRWAYFLTLPASFMGSYGLLNTGKETVFGILFLFGAGARMITGWQESGKERFRIELAAWLSLAFGFGAITIPYALVLLLLYFVFLDEVTGISSILRTISKWCALPLALSFSSILHLPLWSTCLGMGLLYAIIHRAGSFVDHVQERWLIWWRDRGKLGGPACWLALVFITWLLLPVHYPPRDMFPLDGVSDFRAVFLAYNNTYLPAYVGWLAFAGMLLAVTALGVGRGRLPGLRAMACFPFAALIPSLVVARFPQMPLPIRPQHLWDLAKDVPNWCWGPTAVFFAIFFIIITTGWLFQKTSPFPLWKQRITSAASGIILCVHLWHLYGGEGAANILVLRETALFTATGGARDPATALFCDSITRVLSTGHAEGRSRTPRLVIDPSATVISKKWDFCGTGASLVHHLGANEAIQDINLEKNALFVMSSLEKGRELALPGKRLVELGRHDKDSVFLVEDVRGEPGQVIEKPPPAFTAPRPPFLDLLFGKPRIVWDDFADSRVIIKDDDPYLWLKASGTLWLELPRQRKSSEIELSLRLFGEGSSISITSPVFEQPVVLREIRNNINVRFRPEFLNHTIQDNASQWMKLETQYEGPLIRNDQQPYLKSIRLDRLVVCGHEYLK